MTKFFLLLPERDLSHITYFRYIAHNSVANIGKRHEDTNKIMGKTR